MAVLIFSFFLLLHFPLPISSLSTVSISESSSTNHTLVCALIHSTPPHLNCTIFPQSRTIQVPFSRINTPFSGIVGGAGFVCGLGRTSVDSRTFLLCWRFAIAVNGSVTGSSFKRVYKGVQPLNELDAGSSAICGLIDGGGTNSSLRCWQWRGFNSVPGRNATTQQFRSSLTVGDNFVAGLSESGQISCLGRNVCGNTPAGSYKMVSAGYGFACAISVDGGLVCWGQGVSLDREKPGPGLFQSVVLGKNRVCGIRINGTVDCWGLQNDSFTLPESLRETSFESLTASRRVFCGVLTSNYSVICWGNEGFDRSGSLVFDDVVPGPCSTTCPNGHCPLPNYARFCSPGLMICQPCGFLSVPVPVPVPSPSTPLPQANPSSWHWDKRMIAFLVVGCVGCSSLVSVLCFFFLRYCKVSGSKVHDSGPMDDARMPHRVVPGVVDLSTSSRRAAMPMPVLEKRLSHLVSMGNGSRLEEFPLHVLARATDNFSLEHRIGTGSFGSVYRAVLDDGREVAIKRAEVSCTWAYVRQEDSDSAFMNELEFLSRLNHKNLVRLLGFCEDINERVLVYEYVENGSLHDHLHNLDNRSSYVSSWPARIKVALDAARGIEYLHVYAVPPVIHRDIKSSNILLDATWNAKVSDFGLSLMGPSDDESHLSMGAAGTVGYMDPEYFRLQQLTTRSDVYSFGVVLLELLSGKKAIHSNGYDEEPRNVVDSVVPYIVNEEIHRILDPKVPPPTPFEIEAVKYVGYLAADCVTLEGKDRPSMSELVVYLDKALASCIATPVLSPATTSSSLSFSNQLA